MNFVAQSIHWLNDRCESAIWCNGEWNRNGEVVGHFNLKGSCVTFSTLVKGNQKVSIVIHS